MIIVTFYTVSSALYLETLLAAQEVPCRIIPVPRALSSSCGYAAEVADIAPKALISLLSEYELEWEAIYRAASGEEYSLILTQA